VLPPVTPIKTETNGGTCHGVFEGVKFVLKYAFGTHRFPINCVLLKEEENVYAACLKNVQGSLVPRFYGSFKGEVDDEIHLSCIILEDCGTAVSTKFDQLPFEDREKIFLRVVALHDCGVIHAEFLKCNIVVEAGRYRFIDFHNEDINHLCSWNKKTYLGEVEPDLLKLGCAVLYDIGKTLKVWKPDPRLKTFVGQEILDWREKLPEQSVIDALIPKDKTTRGLSSEIYDWLVEYKDVQDRVPPEEYEKIRPFPNSSLFS